jgi:hypothetical protein
VALSQEIEILTFDCRLSDARGFALAPYREVSLGTTNAQRTPAHCFASGTIKG